LAEAIPRLHQFAQDKGRDPAEISVIPFGTIGSVAKLEHYAGLGVHEVVLRLASGQADAMLPELDALAGLLPLAADLSG
jgi:hypothetical protein